MRKDTLDEVAVLIAEYFEDPEVREVISYCMDREMVLDIIELAIAAGKTYIPSVPPVLGRELFAGEDLMPENRFYHKHYDAIRTASSLAGIKVYTKMYLLQPAVDGNPYAINVLTALAQGYSDVPTTIAFLALGPVKAAEFDMKMRLAIAHGDDTAEEIVQLTGGSHG